MNLPLAGAQITAEFNGFIVVLQTESGYELQIETDLHLASPTITNVQSPPDSGEQRDVDPQAFFAGKVQSAEVSDSGSLSLTMESGNRLSVEPDPDFEAWTLTGPGGYRVVCMPGGKLATWESLR